MKLRELLVDDDGHKFGKNEEIRIFSSPVDEWVVLSVYHNGEEVAIDIGKKGDNRNDN